MRTPQQIRTEAAWHEAAHAVAFYIHGHAFEKIEIFRPGETRQQGDLAGCVISTDRPITSVGAAHEAIVELLAGEAGLRMAWALDVLTDAQIGGEEVPTGDLTLEELLVSSNGSKPARAASFGWYERSDHPDERNADEIARSFASDPFEAQAMLNYLKARTSNLVQSERFQKLMNTLADALLEHSELEGALATHLLERADTLHEIESRQVRGGEADGNTEADGTEDEARPRRRWKTECCSRR